MRFRFHSARARRLLTSLVLVVAMVLAQTGQAFAAQIPDPTSSLYLQTSGPNAGLNIGDYYTSPAGGGTDHLFTLTVPSNWPAGTPITVALYDPELAGPDPSSPTARDEVRGSADEATFRLESPSGATIASASYAGAATNGVWVELATFDPGLTGTGTYDIHVSVSDNDDNSWRIDASHDPDCSVGGPGTCGSIDLQNGNESDTAPSGSSPLGLAVVRTSYQHAGSGQVCQDHIFRVSSSTPRPLRAHNFDMDNNGTVTYTTPTGATVPGTVSGNAAWNNSSDATRVGDVLPDVNGWWSAEICISGTNQYVFEAPNAGPSFPVPQPTPRLEITKDDGVSEAGVGDELTYTITVSNVSDLDAYPGDAYEVSIADSLPAGAAFVSCTTAAGVSCVESGGVVAITSDSALAPGSTISADLTVSVGIEADVVLSNTATVAYQDHLGNDFPAASSSDATDIDFDPRLALAATVPGQLLRGDSAAVTYEISHSDLSDGSAVGGVGLVCAACTGLAFVSGDDDSDGLLDSSETWTYSGQIESGSADPDPMTVSASASGQNKNGDVVDASVDVDIDLIEPGSISGTVFEDLDGDGVLDAGEPGIDGGPVVLADELGVVGILDPIDGAYEFNELMPSDYTVDVDDSALDEALVSTNPQSQSLDVPEGASVTDVDFGFAYPVTISGTVFVDDGQAPIVGYEGVSIGLTDDSGLVVATVTTDEDGHYSFSAMPDSYSVTVVGGVPQGWALTTLDPIEVGQLLSGDMADGHDFGIFNSAPEVSDVSEDIQVGGAPVALTALDPEGMDVTFDVVEGSLPPGLALASDGTWGGEALEAGDYSVGILACDTGIPSACSEFRVELTVAEPEVQAVEVEALPFTGIDSDRLLVAGLLLIVGGVIAVGYGRRDEGSAL